MKQFKQIIYWLPRVISYIIFYSPLIVIVALLSEVLPTLFYSFAVIGGLVVLLLNIGFVDMLISHHFLNKATERTLGTVQFDEFAPYKPLGIPYSINAPCASYTDQHQQEHLLWINSKNINTKNLKPGQQLELIYSGTQPAVAQLAIDWDIAQRKHMAENVAFLVLYLVFIVGVNWGFLQLASSFSDIAFSFSPGK